MTSKALTDSEISYEEYTTITNEQENYCMLKESINAKELMLKKVN